MKPSLSVIIITKNNEMTIEKCLLSVAWANEIIVLDSGSTDHTVVICQKYTDKVFQTDWPGFGPQKNRALEKATSEWVYSIDSDEWMDERCRDEVMSAISQSMHLVFSQPRLNQYCGRWIKHGDVGRDKVTRLFKRSEARFSDDIVHERIITQHPIAQLQSRLYHNSYRSLDELLDRMNRYTTLTAQARFARGKKTSMKRAIFAGFWSFTKSYVFRAGFCDGKIGFIVSLSGAQSSYYRHVKLLELQKKL